MKTAEEIHLAKKTLSSDQMKQFINEALEKDAIVGQALKAYAAQAVADYKERLGAALIQLGYRDLLELMDDIADTTN
jgi:plasmid replication initiation protein